MARTTYASRDYSGDTSVLERSGERVRQQSPTSPTRARVQTPTRPIESPRPSRQDHISTERSGRVLRGNRLGSQQRVTNRGRRITPIKNQTILPRISVIAITLLISGIAIAMWLTGLATQQTFAISSLRVENQQLENEVETLNRDLRHVSSTGELTRRAQEMGLVVPQQPGVMVAEENGELSERRPVDPATSPIIDINEQSGRADRASSDPRQTDEVNDALEARPRSTQQLPEESDMAPQPAPSPQSGLAPYAP